MRLELAEEYAFQLGASRIDEDFADWLIYCYRTLNRNNAIERFQLITRIALLTIEATLDIDLDELDARRIARALHTTAYPSLRHSDAPLARAALRTVFVDAVPPDIGD